MRESDLNLIWQEERRVLVEEGGLPCARGYLRYEEMRKLSPLKISELHMRNLNGERWDDMIDELIAQGLK